MLGTKMLRRPLIILLVIYVHNSSCVVDVVYNAAKEVMKLYSMIEKLKLNTTHDIRELNDLSSNSNGKNGEIRSQIDKIHMQLTQLDESISFKMTRDSFKLLPSAIILYRDLDVLGLMIGSIAESYNYFHQYISGDSYHSNRQLQDFTRSIILNIEDKLGSIRRTIVYSRDLPNSRNLLDSITDHTVSLSTHLCNDSQIFSEFLIGMFKMVSLAELKTNTMLAYANIHRYILNEEWKIMNEITRTQFQSYFEKYVNLFAPNILRADQIYLRACDPARGVWIRDESFYELQGVIQTTIFHYRWMNCKFDSCNNIWSNKVDKCEAKYYDRRTSCSGTVDQCAYLNAIKACVLKSGPYKFQYVNSTELGFLGNNSKCPKDNGYLIEDGSSWDVNYGVCACNCYGNHNKISLLTMESNVKSNKVITGVRFLLKDDILYIQPREGKLDPFGQIHRYSEKWINIPHNIKTSQASSIDRENRVFFLDDLQLPPHYALTGIKFENVTRANVKGFAIKIFARPYDYETGKLSSDRKYSIEFSHEKAGEALSFRTISSAHTTLPHLPSSEKMKYVSLERSDLTNDFGQLTLPLFDAVPVRPNPPSMLGGIGLFHKGVDGYAGFISLRVYGVSYADYFRNFQSIYMKDGNKLFNDSYI